MDGRRQPGSRRASRGFTLIELLVVLLLLGIMAGVAGPAIGRFIDSLDFRKQTERVMAALRYARLTAITKGKLLCMTLGDGDNAAPNDLVLSGAVNEVRHLRLAEGATVVLKPEELIFSPEGYATPGKITLESGGRRAVIYLDSLTALPELAEKHD